MSDRKKKLLVTASTFPRWDGDTEPRFVFDLCKELKKDFDITVLVPAAIGAKNEEFMDGIQIIRYHYFPIHRWETLCYPGAIVPRIKEKKIRILLVPFLFLALYKKIADIQKDLDVVHAHWLIPQGIVQSFFSIPYIVTGHGGDVTSLNVPIIKNLKKKCLQHASAITVVSSRLQQELSDYYDGSNAVHVLPMGCDTEFFSPAYRKENYFGQQGQNVVLFVGRLAEKKGVCYLLEAMKDIDAILVIVGTGPLENQLRQQAATINRRIEFWGAKTHEELRSIYASADIFVAPSVTARDGDTEGFGLVILEAMASGVPVVASDSGGIPEIITHQENGLLVKERDVAGLSNAINSILSNSKLKDTLTAAALVTAQSHSYKAVAQKYGELLKNI